MRTTSLRRRCSIARLNSPFSWKTGFSEVSGSLRPRASNALSAAERMFFSECRRRTNKFHDCDSAGANFALRDERPYKPRLLKSFKKRKVRRTELTIRPQCLRKAMTRVQQVCSARGEGIFVHLHFIRSNSPVFLNCAWHGGG